MLICEGPRYVGAVRFADAVAAIIDVPAIDQMENSGPSRLLLADLTTGEVREVDPPEGTRWTYWPGPLVEIETGLAWLSILPDDSGECLVAIEGGESRIIRCLPGEFVASVDPSEGGVTALTFPAGENLNDCRRRVFVPIDGGEPVLLGDDDGCTPFDGVVLDGWQVWSQVNPADPFYLGLGSLLANGPNGEELALGHIRSGSLRL